MTLPELPTICHSCLSGEHVFLATFPDGYTFRLCADCTDDLCALQGPFQLEVVITSINMMQDEHPWTDPAETPDIVLPTL